LLSKQARAKWQSDVQHFGPLWSTALAVEQEHLATGSIPAACSSTFPTQAAAMLASHALKTESDAQALFSTGPGNVVMAAWTLCQQALGNHVATQALQRLQRRWRVERGERHAVLWALQMHYVEKGKRVYLPMCVGEARWNVLRAQVALAATAPRLYQGPTRPLSKRGGQIKKIQEETVSFFAEKFTYDDENCTSTGRISHISFQSDHTARVHYHQNCVVVGTKTEKITIDPVEVSPSSASALKRKSLVFFALPNRQHREQVAFPLLGFAPARKGQGDLSVYYGLFL
ncbi:MAG: hypothetical protein AAFX99_35660, partial [Myxococcota bacterium]